MARRKPAPVIIPDPSWVTQDEAHAALIAEGATHAWTLQGEPHPMVTYYRPSPRFPGAYGYAVLSRYSDGLFRHGPWLLAHDGMGSDAVAIAAPTVSQPAV